MRHYEQFFFWPQCFQMTSIAEVSVCGKGLRSGFNDIVWCHKCLMPYIRMMEDNYVLFDIIADGNFFFPEKKKCWNPVSVCYCERPIYTKNDIKLILPEKVY